jgi:hypothetical protein
MQVHAMVVVLRELLMALMLLRGDQLEVHLVPPASRGVARDRQLRLPKARGSRGETPACPRRRAQEDVHDVAVHGGVPVPVLVLVR